MGDSCFMARILRIRVATCGHCRCKEIESLSRLPALHSMSGILNFRLMADGWHTIPTNPADSRFTSYRFPQAVVNGRFRSMEASRPVGVTMGESCISYRLTEP